MAQSKKTAYRDLKRHPKTVAAVVSSRIVSSRIVSSYIVSSHIVSSVLITSSMTSVMELLIETSCIRDRRVHMFSWWNNLAACLR